MTGESTPLSQAQARSLLSAAPVIAAAVTAVWTPLALRAPLGLNSGPGWAAFSAEALVRAIVSLSLWHAAGRRSGDERRLLQGAAVASALIGVAASFFRWQWYAPGNTLPIADTCQLLGYAVLIATMMRLQAAGRSVGSKWIIWIESLSVGVSVGLLAWHFIVRGNYTYSTFGATIGPTLELVYPILDSLLIVLTFDLSRGRMRVNLGWVLAVVACCLGDAILSIDAYVTSNPAINAMGDILGSGTIVGFAVLAQQASTRRPLVQSIGPSLGFEEHLRNPMSISAAVLVVLAVSTATVSELAGHGVDGILWLAGLAVVALIRFVRVIIIAQERAGAAERIQRDLEGRIAERMSELANLTEARTRLVATMSHEIRSPLNAILGLTHLMTVRDDVTPSQRETLGRIQQHGRHLVRLSENVLAMARIESGTETLRRDPFDLDDVLLQTMDVLRRDAEAKGLRVTLERPADLPRWLVGDQTRLTQLLLNYVSNAVKATTQGGITLRLFASAVGERVELTGEVSDTGPGIPPENLTQLFQRFERLAGATGPEPGSGLGLAICRWIAEQMEGAVGVRSVLGGGTTFWFRVLLDRQPATAGAPAPQVPTSPPGRRRVQRGARVLVVDDIPVNREIAREVLTAVGMDVVEADGGRAAVRLALSEPFDAVLMDLRMPDMDGFTPRRRFGATTAGAPCSFPAARSPMSRSGLPPAARSASATPSDHPLARPAAGSGGQAQRAHAARVVLGEPREHPPHLGEIRTGAVDPADQQGGQRIAFGRNALRLRQCLTDEPTTPQGESARDPGIVGDRRADAVHDELRVPEVVANSLDEGARLIVDIGRDLAIEVHRDPIADIGLHQSLEPVARGGVLVELLERAAERLHRLLGDDADGLEAITQRDEVAELGGGHLGQSGFVVNRRRECRIDGRALERHELAVGQHAEQVDDRGPVGRVGLDGVGCRGIHRA